MAASSEKDCPLTNLVFDLRNHNEATSERLLSAADFVLRYAFDKPVADPLTLTKLPIAYIIMGKSSSTNFIAAKLLALNMLHLEDAIMKHCSVWDLLPMSDQALNSMIEEVLNLKEQKNKQGKEPLYPKGTGISVEICWDVMEAKMYEPKDGNSSSDLCRICKKDRLGKMVFTLPYCQHEFHTACMERGFGENRLCPICQTWAFPIQAEYPKWIKDLGKVRDFLARDFLILDGWASFMGQRHIVCVSACHALMAHHIAEFRLTDVLKNFKEQIYTIMEHEKETRIDELDMIKEEVVQFLKDCRYIEEGRLVERFHLFMERMFRVLCLDDVHQNEFWKMVRKVNVDQLKKMKSMRKLSRFVQAVEYVQGGV